MRRIWEKYRRAIDWVAENDSARKWIQFECLYGFAAVITLLMTILNAVTGIKGSFLVSAGLFFGAVLSLLMSRRNWLGGRRAAAVFSIS